MSSAKYLIVGNSAAAVGAVTGIRQEDPDGSIMIVAKEKEHAYSRPLITYLLGGKVGEKDMHYRPESYYFDNEVEARLGVEVTGVDPAAKRVKTADGGEIGYEKLLIATGGRPIVPPGVEGLDAKGVFTFTTWQDSRDIAAYIEANGVTKAVVVGGGLIGLKSVEALVARGVQTTVVELADRVLAITLDAEASALAAQALNKAGVTLLTNNTVTKVQSKDGKVSGVELRDGSTVEAGLLIMAIGVVPDTRLLGGAAVEIDRGILVDDHMRTNAADIYAAGDVAQGLEILSGRKMPIPIWPTAYRMGYIAGVNMAGGEKTYGGGLAMNSVEICGLPTISAGLTVPREEGYEVLVKSDAKTGSYRKVVLKDGRLVGSVLVGDIDRAGIFTGLILSGMDLSSLKDKLLSEDFGLISLPADYRTRLAAGQGV